MKNNITLNIQSKIGRNLHRLDNHPIEIIKRLIASKFDSFILIDNLPPLVKIQDNFDSLLIPKTHVSRSSNDSYYYDDETMLRTHTSAHQHSLLAKNLDRFLVVGDVYRRDEIDATHFPVFHQMEGVKVMPKDTSQDICKKDLIDSLTGLVLMLFPGCEYRVIDSYFPFTDPSFEIEINWNGRWLEVLGCGIIQPQIMKNAGRENETGWAFGLGLERLAMVLFEIPDIRLFWSEDRRFLDQFVSGQIVKFKPCSKHPGCYKDISFWINHDTFNYNDFCEIVRETGNDLVESVEARDKFVHPKTGQTSHCYRVWYRSHDHTLTNEQVNSCFFALREQAEKMLKITLR